MHSMAMLTVRDESVGGDSLHEFTLENLNDRITVRELIRSRVYQEARDLQAKAAAENRDGVDCRALVVPADAERTLNGIRVDTARKVDWKEQADRAAAAFESNGIVILINDRQAETLDEEFDVGPSTDVTFLKLTALVGG